MTPLTFLFTYFALILAVTFAAHGVIAALTLWLERRGRDRKRNARQRRS